MSDMATSCSSFAESLFPGHLIHVHMLVARPFRQPQGSVVLFASLRDEILYSSEALFRAPACMHAGNFPCMERKIA